MLPRFEIIFCPSPRRGYGSFRNAARSIFKLSLCDTRGTLAFIILFVPASLPSPRCTGENHFPATAAALRCAVAITGEYKFSALLKSQHSY